MFKNTTFIWLTVAVFSISCNQPLDLKPIPTVHNTISQANFENYDFKNWHFKDIELDTIPGISLNRALDSFLVNIEPKARIIVAVIDSEIDINHTDLKQMIWTNSNEVLDNNLDDDKNGYVDDINGWNFLGNLKGENNKYVNFEITRILKRWNPYFENKPIEELSRKDSVLYLKYKKVKKRYNERLAYFIEEKANYDLLYTMYYSSKENLDKFFVNKEYSIKTLDSLRLAKIKGINEDVLFLIELLQNNVDDVYVLREKKHANEMLEKLLGLDYNDREIQGDNENNLRDTNYGNNIVNNNVEFLNHGTKTAGVISKINQKNDIKIMPLVISCYGDEHDKDITLAIRYAVDNGAKIINMSIGKEFSLHRDWVYDAIKYAEQHDVLIVSSGGNTNYNLNEYNDYYPNDNIENKDELSDNFLLIGGSTYFLNEGLKDSSSSYGKIDIDLFAPGDKIYTTTSNDEYTRSFGGTSAASAITSGVAALVRSYYPDLTASQVKHILMVSGVEYTFDVKVGDTLVPFNTLSKSGKILNAYNAMIMADSISRRN